MQKSSKPVLLIMSCSGFFMGTVMFSRDTDKAHAAFVLRSHVFRSRERRWSSIALGAVGFWLGGYAAASAQSISSFTPGDLVISTVSCQAGPACTSTSGGLDTASPISLQEFSLGSGGASATSIGSLVLPQTQNSGGAGNSPISGEYGSASEGILQQSANGQYLTIIGYGVNANTFNAQSSNFGTAALGQTTSTAGNPNGVTTVPRVVALIGGNGGVNTTTALTGVFNENNPRSVATVNGSSFYVSGQGVTGDGTGGVFYATLGATTATAINANTTSPKGTPNGTANPAVATETRSVEIYNGQLYVSRDFGAKGSPNDTTDIRSLTGPGGLPTSAAGLTVTRVLPTVNSSGGNTGSIDLTNQTDNGVNSARDPQSPKYTGGNTFVYLSPEEFFFANSTTLYVADSGEPKNGNANAAALGDGGLQKWTLSNGVWTLDYDLAAGLNLANNANANANTPAAPGVTGLFGLTGEVVGNNVELFATSYGLNELSQSFLYEITDLLGATTLPTNESFTTLYSAPSDTLIRGVAFAPTGSDDPLTPTPLPASWTFMLIGLAGFGWAVKRRGSSGMQFEDRLIYVYPVS